MGNIFIRTNIAPYRIDIYNAIHERLNAVMCFYEREGKAQKFDVEQIEARCNFKPVYLKGITFGSMNRKLCFGLWKLLYRECPNVVIVPEFQLSAFQFLFFRWITHKHFKIVSMTDDSYDMIINDNDFTKLHKWLRNHIAQYIDDFIVVTPEVEKWYQTNFGKGIWMPIIMDERKAIEYYERLLPKSYELAKKYDLNGRKILLYVGRLVDLKNLHRVLDAFSQVQTEATLVIVGDGPEKESLMHHAKKINKEIIFTGRFDGDDLYAWYNLASCMILASKQEAFGAVTNEALLAGCRVIVSNRAGSSCLVNEHNGELINPLDISNITSAINRQMALAVIPNLTSVRKNLMTVSFNERINNLVNHLSQ